MQACIPTKSSCIASELDKLEQQLTQHIKSDVILARMIGKHLLKHAGKRIRPTLMILSALACGYPKEQTEHIELSCIVEYIHTASLLHDDVIDQAVTRRNQPTAANLWGNKASILGGDFLHAKAFQMLSRIANPDILKILANSTSQLIEGELEQLHQNGNAQLSAQQYLKIIEAKTASLFSASTELGAVLAQSTAQQQTLYNVGHYLGMSFQILDDTLDYTPENKSGKPCAQDIQQGTVTLPFIIAYNQSSNSEKNLLASMLGQENTQLSDVCDIFTRTQALTKSQTIANQMLDNAKTNIIQLPSSIYREELSKLINSIV